MKPAIKHVLSSGVTLVLGGARSGKSGFGEALVSDSGLNPVYLATARGADEEMLARIELHQERRDVPLGVNWQTIEEPLALADALKNSCYAGQAVLVDCLTLWVTNLMIAEADVEREIVNLVNCVKSLPAPVVFVSNEIGLGIVPNNAMSREFRDYTGTLHQQIAAKADQVFFVVAGIPMHIKTGA